MLLEGTSLETSQVNQAERAPLVIAGDEVSVESVQKMGTVADAPACKEPPVIMLVQTLTDTPSAVERTQARPNAGQCYLLKDGLSGRHRLNIMV